MIQKTKDNRTEFKLFLTIKNYQHFIQLATDYNNRGLLNMNEDEIQYYINEYKEIIRTAYSELNEHKVKLEDRTKWYTFWKSYVDMFDDEMWDIALYIADNNIDLPEFRPDGDYKNIHLNEYILKGRAST